MPRPPIAPPALDPTPLAPGLYVVSTPIGNMRDITLRALDVLARCDLILAEDTRMAQKVVQAYALGRPRVLRCDDHSWSRSLPEVCRRLTENGAVAVTSDAGTPLISDPGYAIVRTVLEAGFPVYTVPGASAVTAALTVAGLPTDRFTFVGFPPPKSAARRKFLTDLAGARATLVFYEGGSRLAQTLEDMAEIFGPRPAAVCRELTKLHESVTRATLDILAADPAFAEPKGELVIVVGPGAEETATEADADAALTDALSRLAPGEAAAEVARELGLNRRDLYRRALKIKENT